MEQKIRSTTVICVRRDTKVVMAGDGQVIPVIDRHYPLEEATKAIRYLTEGHARGKLVITVP